MTVSKDDLPQVADLAASLAERIRDDGPQVWSTLHDRTKGPQRPASTGERGGDLDVALRGLVRG